jgi:hypothetical protein
MQVLIQFPRTISQIFWSVIITAKELLCEIEISDENKDLIWFDLSWVERSDIFVHCRSGESSKSETVSRMWFSRLLGCLLSVMCPWENEKVNHFEISWG